MLVTREKGSWCDATYLFAETDNTLSGARRRRPLRVSLERAHARRMCGNSTMHYVGKWKRIYDRRIGILQLSNREHELISGRYRSLGSNPVSYFFAQS